MNNSRYVIDSDIMIYFLKSHPQVVQNFQATDADDMVTTIINYVELLFGAYNSAKVTHNVSQIKSFLEAFQIIPFDKTSAGIFAQQKSLLRQAGTPIADLDIIIASICLTNNFTLVTNNTKHFNRIKGLRLENWSED